MGNHPLNDLHFLFTRDPVFPTFWSAMPLRLPVLTAWAAGPLADAKRGMTQDQIKNEALRALSRGNYGVRVGARLKAIKHIPSPLRIAVRRQLINHP